MPPAWLDTLSWVALGAAFASALYLIVSVLRRPQGMAIMNVVWPVTALYMGPFAVWAYYRMSRREKPFWQAVFVGVTHCGSGCTLGDILAEFAIFYGAIVIVADAFYTSLALDYAAAYVLGIAFQYLSIAPMRGEWGAKSVGAAVKVDTLSLTAFEIGLFAWMAVTHFVLFGHGLTAASPTYWFMMQIGMCLGFLTSYPMNWWLIRRGIKEPM